MRLGNLQKYARNYSVDEETCTQCMQCVEYCLTDNITFENETFTWGNKCNLCLRCYHLCPEDAILFKKATLDRSRYPGYKGPGDGFTVSKLKKWIHSLSFFSIISAVHIGTPPFQKS